MKTKMLGLRKRVLGKFIVEPMEERFWRMVDKSTPDSCWEWMGNRHYKGYGEFTLPSGSYQQKTKAHRMAWELSTGINPGGSMVCHTCDNPPCCNPSHLFLGNAKTNKDDAVNKHRHCYGEKSPKSKLTESQVIEIRELDKTNLTRLKIAARFGISGRQVTSICRHESWAHVLAKSSIHLPSPQTGT
jgi:hypothetical protein